MKVLISSRSFGKTGAEGIEILKKAGLEPIINTTGKKLNENDLLKMADGVVGIIAGTEKIPEKIILEINSLKVISRYGVGLDNIDLNAAKQKGILVFNTPDSPTDAVSELTLSLILNLLRKICAVDREIRKGSWQPQLGNLLSGKTVGILGLGKIGKKVVQLLEPFNAKFLTYEKNPDKEFISKYNIDVVSFDTVLTKSDIITIHLPSTEETNHILGEKEFLKMKQTALLINTARGDLIDEKALYNALKNKIIAGAALDVFENEPYTGKLKELDNTILTPHIGSCTVETRKRMDIESAENLIAGLKKMGVYKDA
ncbi:MAG: phosphoglycerate dehydrogenase [bacterium]